MGILELQIELGKMNQEQRQNRIGKGRVWYMFGTSRSFLEEGVSAGVVEEEKATILGYIFE